MPVAPCMEAPEDPGQAQCICHTHIQALLLQALDTGIFDVLDAAIL